MARTVIEDSGPAYVEDDSGPVLGIVVGLLIAAAIVVLAVLFFNGTFDSGSGGTTHTPGNQPSAPTQQQSQEPQPSSTP